MSSIYEDLAYLIEENVKGCVINWYAVIAGEIAGKINGIEFSITFKEGKSLSISADYGSDIFGVIKPLLAKFLQCEPLCSYDLVSIDGRVSVMEWHLINRERRIAELINANPYDDVKIVNLCTMHDDNQV